MNNKRLMPYMASMTALSALVLGGCHTAGPLKDRTPTNYRSHTHTQSQSHRPTQTTSHGVNDNIPRDIRSHKQAYQVPNASKHTQQQPTQNPSILPPGNRMAHQHDKQTSDQAHQRWQQTAGSAQHAVGGQTANEAQQKAHDTSRKGDKKDEKAQNKVQNQSKLGLSKLGLKQRNGKTVLDVPESKNHNTLTQLKNILKKAHYRVLRVDSTQGDLFVLDTQSSNGQIDEATPLYRLHVSDGRNGVKTIQAFDEKNQQLPQKAAQSLLSQVKQGWQQAG